MPRGHKILWTVLIFAVILNAGLWLTYRHAQARWSNVPPVPGKTGTAGLALGDRQFAYRAIAVMLQNLGDTGGRSTVFDAYHYDDLLAWFRLADKMDPRSNFVPYLAAYYYGAAQKPEQHRLLISYLREAGNRPEGQKWRWLAHATYLARYKVGDLELALELANELADLVNKSDRHVPAWARQMPAFIQTARGEKEAALAIMIEILKSSADKMHPNEVNSMHHYICTQLLLPGDARQNPLCEPWL